ncbi:MAG: OmpH family outer membrane protein, partial [Bdellovibrionales bacterium]|nr:OmpH family outer membrane protein [Bdellovibrionales bacterium]
MKFWIFIFLASLFSPVCFAKTGYVDMKAAIQSTRQGRRAQNKLQKDLEKVKKEISALEARLTKERAKLEEEIPLLSEQKRAQRVQKFQQQVLESQKKAEEKKAALQQLENKLMNPIVQKLQTVIGQVAAKEGYTAILNKDNNVLWVSSDLDMTKKVSS